MYDYLPFPFDICQRLKFLPTLNVIKVWWHRVLDIGKWHSNAPCQDKFPFLELSSSTYTFHSLSLGLYRSRCTLVAFVSRECYRYVLLRPKLRTDSFLLRPAKRITVSALTLYKTVQKHI